MENSSTSTSGYAGSGPTASSMPGQGGQPGTPILQQTQQKAGEVIDQARTQVTEQLESQKQRLTGAISGLAQAIRQTGDQLQQQNQAPFGQYAHSAADAVERLSGYLSERDVPQMIGGVENYARYRPVMFLGSAFALGLIAARFLKSSGPGDGSPGGMNGNSAGNYPAGSAWSSPTSTMDAVDTYRTAGSVSSAGSAGSEIAVTTVTGASLSGDAEEEDDFAPAPGLGGQGIRSEATG